MTWCYRGLCDLPGHLGMARSEADFRRKLRHLKVPVRDWPEFVMAKADVTTHFFERGNSVCAVVCYRPDGTKTRSQIAAMMAHEAVHVWRSAMERLGEKDPSEEFMAYGIQNITQTLLTVLWGKKK